MNNYSHQNEQSLTFAEILCISCASLNPSIRDFITFESDDESSYDPVARGGAVIKKAELGMVKEISRRHAYPLCRLALKFSETAGSLQENGGLYCQVSLRRYRARVSEKNEWSPVFLEIRFVPSLSLYIYFAPTMENVIAGGLFTN
jgi:hypothetical protein